MQKWCPAEPVCATCRLNSIACMENAGELVPLHDQNWIFPPRSHSLVVVEEMTYKEW